MFGPSKVERKLDHLIRLARGIRQDLYVLKLQGRIDMSLSQDLLDAVAAETTVIDSFISLVQGLIENNTIPPEAGAAILAAINSNKDKVEAAILADTNSVKR